MPLGTRLLKRIPFAGALRKKIILARLRKKRASEFSAGLAMIHELHGQFGEWHGRWISRHDEAARKLAMERLWRIRAIIRELSQNGHRAELEMFLKRNKIPGWRIAMQKPRTRSR